VSINPYQSPQAEGGPVQPTRSREYLRAVASNQRGVLYCLLGQIVLHVALWAIPMAIDSNAQAIATAMVIVLAALVVIIIAGSVFCYRLAAKLGSERSAVLYTCFSLIPCVGLAVLALLNLKATSVLRAHGVSVGLMGASLSKL